MARRWRRLDFLPAARPSSSRSRSLRASRWQAPYELESGKYYSIDINADGSAELALTGSGFVRNVWVDEVIINEIEVRPLGIDSLEFDGEGTFTISFVTIRPGTFTLQIPGTTSESQRATFNVK